jgi:hypothetical protein
VPAAGSKTVQSLHYTSDKNELEIAFDATAEVTIRKDSRVMIAVLPGKPAAGQKALMSFAVKVAGEIDHKPVTIALDAAHPGQLFDGMGGNFRLQNPKADPGIIDYNLQNLRVAWGRVEMPWRSGSRMKMAIL